MKQFILFLLLCPLLSVAQNKPRFENDTLYTSCGYKIYNGQTMQFGKAMGWDGFRHIIIKNGIRAASLENNSIVVKDISDLDVSSLGNYYIDIKGNIVFKDGSKGAISIHMAFDHAIGNIPGVPGELLVPDEFRNAKANANADYSPNFQGDTLYTSCGYQIYKGKVLQFGKATGDRSRFMYVNIKNRVPPLMLQYNQVRVKEQKDFGISALGNGYITVTGTLIVNNNERGDIEMHMAFDHAIENIPGVPSELVVPAEFRNRLKADPQAEVHRLEDLYRNQILTKEEFEAIKKKLLGQ